MADYDKQDEGEEKAKETLSVGSVEVDSEDAETYYVREWTKKIQAARAKYKANFDLMRKWMAMSYGVQWDGQKDLNDDRYRVNLINRAVNNKVATLYAHDPKAVYRQRKRMNYSVWDEKHESAVAAVMRESVLLQHGMPGDPKAAATINDYEHGRLEKARIDRVGRTLETVYQYQIDTQEPDFKTQMKQLVRRVVTCGVGYIKVSFERKDETVYDSMNSHSSIIDRAKMMSHLAEMVEDEGGEKQSAMVERIRLLAQSIASSTLNPGPEQEGMTERLVFDFIPSTAIIPDPCCRSLKGFVGAHWLVHEMYCDVNDVNAYYETDIKVGNDAAKAYKADGDVEDSQPQEGQRDEGKAKKVCIWHVYDMDTKSCFTLCEGYKCYVCEPEPLEPQVRGFWPILALTFNDCEFVEGSKASIFPPSDVDFMMHPQHEWNRSRDGLRAHRKGKAPKWLTPKGHLTENDLANIEAGKPCQMIQLEGVTKQDDILKMLIPFPHEPIDPACYDTRPLVDDIMFAVGAQEANLGPAKANVTATTSSIAEQSRLSMSSSNVDDLDDFLSAVARVSGEMLLRDMTQQTAMKIAGEGGSWPEQDRDFFLNGIFLETVAASSGRPNKAMELQNARELGPLLLQAGANPQFLVRELVKRLDDRMDPEEAFPLQAPSPVPPAKPAQMSGPPGPTGGAPPPR